MKTVFNSTWVGNHICSEEATLSQLDSYNKTRYSRRKNQDGLLELASREAHEKQQVYFASILSDDDSPYCAIESNAGYFGIYFLGEDLENYLICSFRDFERKGEKLFLSSITLLPRNQQDFDDTYNMTWYFDEDKTWGIIKYRGSVGTWNSQKEVSLTPLSEDEHSLLCLEYPKFGEYDQLIRLDRIPQGVLEKVLEVTDVDFPRFREYLQRDIDKYQEGKA